MCTSVRRVLTGAAAAGTNCTRSQMSNPYNRYAACFTSVPNITYAVLRLCIVLYCIVLYCYVLYCIVLYCCISAIRHAHAQDVDFLAVVRVYKFKYKYKASTCKETVGADLGMPVLSCARPPGCDS